MQAGRHRSQTYVVQNFTLTFFLVSYWCCIYVGMTEVTFKKISITSTLNVHEFNSFSELERKVKELFYFFEHPDSRNRYPSNKKLENFSIDIVCVFNGIRYYIDGDRLVSFPRVNAKDVEWR
jgi:hypothetical protein